MTNIRRLNNPRFNADALAIWWQDNLHSEQVLIARSEPQACNWFPILSFPQRIFLHSLLGEKKKPDPVPLCYQSHRFGAGVFSFQTPRALIQALEPMGITVDQLGRGCGVVYVAKTFVLICAVHVGSGQLGRELESAKDENLADLG